MTDVDETSDGSTDACPVCGEPYASVFETDATLEYLHPTGKECEEPKYLPHLDVETPAEYAELLADETRLSKPESQVVARLTTDSSNEEIAETLDVSVEAVEDRIESATETATRARRSVELLTQGGFEPAIPTQGDEGDDATEEAAEAVLGDALHNPSSQLLYHTTDVVDGPNASPFPDDEDDEDS